MSFVNLDQCHTGNRLKLNLNLGKEKWRKDIEQEEEFSLRSILVFASGSLI